MSHAIDLEGLRLQGDLQKMPSQASRPPRVTSREPFLKGPVPWLWLTKAGGLPGKSLQVGVYLWFLTGKAKTKTHKLSMGALDCIGVKYDAGYDALNSLEGAGLVTVVRHRGRKPIVTIIVPREWPAA